MKNATIIIADAPALHGIRQRVQQIAMRFQSGLAGCGGQILYIDEPGNMVTVFLSPEKPISNLWSWIKGPTVDESIGVRHFVPPAGLPFGYHNRAVNRWNHFWYRACLGGRYKKGNGPVVLIVCNVLGLGWIGKFREDVVIYDCADEISEFRQASLNREAVLKQERELIGKADALVATSESLYESKSKYTGPGRRAVLIRNAVEVEHFRQALQALPRPDDIAGLKKPIVGFYGFLADWLDWKLIEHIVREGAEFDWVFIGPTTLNLSDLESFSNFHYLGKKPYADLPSYLAHFLCAIIPFDRTPLTIHVNPVKLYEYLAGGVPVVATSLPELEPFRDVCRITNDPREYLEAIREEISSDSPEERIRRSKRVKDETWDKRAEGYMGLISELLMSK